MLCCVAAKFKLPVPVTDRLLAIITELSAAPDPVPVTASAWFGAYRVPFIVELAVPLIVIAAVLLGSVITRMP